MKSKMSSTFVMLSKVFILLWRSSKKHLIGMSFVNIISGILLSVEMIIWKKIIDKIAIGIVTNDFRGSIVWFIIYMLANVLIKILDEATNYLKNILAVYTNKYITLEVLKKIKDISMEEYGDSEIQNKIKKTTDESTSRIMNMLYSSGQLIKGISVFVSTALILIKFNVMILVLCTIVGIPLFAVEMQIAQKQYDIYNERFENRRLIEYLKSLLTRYENVKEVKVYNVTDYFLTFIGKTFNKYILEDKKIRGNFCKKNVAVYGFENLLVICAKIFVGTTTILNKMTIGDFTLYINSIDNYRYSINNILSVITSLYEDGLYIENLFELIKIKSKEKQNNVFNRDFKKLVFENVWFKYPKNDTYVLKGINLEFERGKCYALVGLNGSGKTTLLKLLLKLYIPTKGRIVIDGIDIFSIPDKEYYEFISAVFQDFIKYPLTIRENIAMGDYRRINDLSAISEAAKKSGIYSYIVQLRDQFETQLQMEWKDATELSLGQWQKLAISRAFFKESLIMVLDEPTASLDPDAEMALSNNIRKLIKGKTCIIVAHRFSTVRLVDTIYVIKDGMIEEKGTHRELINQGKEYERLFRLQAKGYLD